MTGRSQAAASAALAARKGCPVQLVDTGTGWVRVACDSLADPQVRMGAGLNAAHTGRDRLKMAGGR